jgi:hypothetical protein
MNGRLTTYLDKDLTMQILNMYCTTVHDIIYSSFSHNDYTALCTKNEPFQPQSSLSSLCF